MEGYYSIRPIFIKRYIKLLLIVVIIIIGGWFFFQSDTIVTENVTEDTVEVIAPSEEELRKMEWEKEAEEVKANHLRKKELEFERSVLQSEVDEKEKRISEIEKELGF